MSKRQWILRLQASIVRAHAQSSRRIAHRSFDHGHVCVSATLQDQGHVFSFYAAFDVHPQVMVLDKQCLGTAVEQILISMQDLF